MKQVDWKPDTNQERTARERFPGPWFLMREQVMNGTHYHGVKCALLIPPDEPREARWVPVDRVVDPTSEVQPHQGSLPESGS
jgi:hypothetical protein